MRRVACIALSSASVVAGFVACKGDTAPSGGLPALSDGSEDGNSSGPGDGPSESRPSEDAKPGLDSCAPPSSGAVAPSSSPGSRLHVRHLVADGLDLPREIVDVRFNHACTFQFIQDGSLACVPDTRRCHFTGGTLMCLDDLSLPRAELAFSDPTCTSPVVLDPSAGVTDLASVVSSPQPTCAIEAHAGTVGAEITPTPATVYIVWPFDGRCYARSVDASRHVYELTAEALVTAAWKRIPLTARTDAMVLEASDGSSLFAGDVFDRVHGQRVWPQPDPSGVTRLLPGQIPLSASPPTAWRTAPPPADASAAAAYCASPSTFFPVQGANCPAFGPGSTMVYGTAASSPSDAGSGLFGLGLATPVVYPSCDSGIGFDAGLGFLLGAAIPSCTMELAPPMTVGTGRLVASVASVGGAPIGAAIPYAEDMPLRDKTLGVGCVPRVADDGVLRCLPRDASLVFSDPSCTQRVALAPSTPSPPKYATLNGDTYSNIEPMCDPAVYAVMAPTTVMSLYGRGGEATECRCVEIFAPLGSATYAVGGAVAASTFAPVSITLP